MTEHVVADVDDVPEGEHLLVEVVGRDVGIFNVDGELRAYTSWCAHQGGPVCEGRLSGTTRGCYDRENLTLSVEWVRENKILLCPWHGWEYDVTDGSCRSDERVQLPSHPVRAEDGKIVVTL